ncbi:MAG: LysM peptidoglycan-binding domain-containing protein [Desulfobacteraceae bacterium]|jgi:LysM repeat protein
MDEDLRLNLDLAETVTGTRSRRSLPLTSYLVFAGIVVLIMAAGFALFFQFHKGSTADLDPIKNRLKMVEQSLPQLAGLVMELQQSVSKLNATEQSLSKRMDELSSETAQLQRAVVAEQTKSKVPASDQEESAVKTDAAYHQVQQGETLYGIAKKYGISLAELCRLNQISTGQPIKPGQKLLVSKQGR